MRKKASHTSEGAITMIEEVRRQFKSIPALSKALELMRKYEGKDQSDWTDEDRKVLNRLTVLPNTEDVLRFLQ